MITRLSRVDYWMMQGEETCPMRFSTAARIRGDLTLDQLQTAIVKVRERHPLLAARAVQDDAGQPWFSQDGVPDIALRVVEARQEDEWLRVVAEELARPFPLQTGPLVRFAWVKGERRSDLIVICHHVIADGLAVVYLLRDLLRHLGDPALAVERLPATPPIGEMIPREVDAVLDRTPVPDLIEWMLFGAHGTQLGRVGKLVTRSIIGLLRSPLGPAIVRRVKRRAARARGRTPAPGQRPQPPAWHIHAWSLTRAQTDALVERARQERTTVHAALGAAFLLALRQAASSGRPRRIIQCPVNLRNRLAHPVGECFASFVALACATVDCSPGRGFWDVARDLKDGLNRVMTPERLFAAEGVGRALCTLLGGEMPPAGNTEKACAHASHVDYDLSLSNIGRLDIPTTYGSLTLESLYGPTFSASGNNRVLGVNTTGGRLFFTFICRRAAMPNSAVQKVRDLAMSQLQETLGWLP